MKPPFLLSFREIVLSLLVVAVTVVGCGGSRTKVTSVTFFPPFATVQTAKHTLIVEARGEPGKAYTNIGPKNISIILTGNISQRDESIKRQNYVLVAGDLDWTIAWTNFENVQIEFVDHSSKIKAGKLVFSPTVNDGLEELTIQGLQKGN